MCSRAFRPLGLPIYVARVPAAPFSLLPSSLYLDHSHCLVLAPATLAALPSTRAIPDRDVFYVARPARSVAKLRNQKKLFCVWIFHDGPGRKTGDIDILVLFRQIRTRDHAFPAWDRNCVGQTSFCFFHIRG